MTKTRRAVKDAPVRLILEKGYEAVTVQDIIDRADVGRSTFYAHFFDKDELRLEFFRNPGVPTPDVAALRVKGVPCAWSLQMFQHFDAAKRTYRVLVGRQSGARIHDELDRVLDRLVREELQFQMARRPETRGPRDTLPGERPSSACSHGGSRRMSRRRRSTSSFGHWYCPE